MYIPGNKEIAQIVKNKIVLIFKIKDFRDSKDNKDNLKRIDKEANKKVRKEVNKKEVKRKALKNMRSMNKDPKNQSVSQMQLVRAQLSRDFL